MGLAQMLRRAREAAGLNVPAVAALGHVSKGHLYNVEKGLRPVTETVWLAYEKALGMNRRHLFHLATAALVAPPSSAGDDALAGELFASIAAGDHGVLTGVQTSHAVDHGLARRLPRERRTVIRLSGWMNDGETAVLRVNAAGILAKTGNLDLADDVAVALDRDGGMRERYLEAVTTRVGRGSAALARELSNPSDSGARWCAAHLLAEHGHTTALAAALRAEPCRENLRAMGLAILEGDHRDRDRDPRRRTDEDPVR